MKFKVLGAVAGCGLLIFLLYGLYGPDFYTHWRHLKAGMTQAEVRRAVGAPTEVGVTTTIGAGDRPLTRWQYKRGHLTYCVDFDYLGPGGAPVVYRTERWREAWEWPWWWPFVRARARA